MIENRLAHHHPFKYEYEYEYRFTEYEYEKMREPSTLSLNAKDQPPPEAGEPLRLTSAARSGAFFGVGSKYPLI